MVVTETCFSDPQRFLVIIQRIEISLLYICDVAKRFIELPQAKHLDRAGIFAKGDTVLCQRASLIELGASNQVDDLSIDGTRFFRGVYRPGRMCCNTGEHHHANERPKSRSCPIPRRANAKSLFRRLHKATG
jgi:hypothetical protein